MPACFQVFFLAANIYGWYGVVDKPVRTGELKIRWLLLPKAPSRAGGLRCFDWSETVFINPAFAFDRVRTRLKPLGLQVAMPNSADASPGDSCMMVLSIVAMT